MKMTDDDDEKTQILGRLLLRGQSISNLCAQSTALTFERFLMPRGQCCGRLVGYDANDCLTQLVRAWVEGGSKTAKIGFRPYPDIGEKVDGRIRLQ
jgi:hypothetical protein